MIRGIVLEHAKYGSLVMTGNANNQWITSEGTRYGSFLDITGQQINIPLSEVQVKCYA